MSKRDYSMESQLSGWLQLLQAALLAVFFSPFEAPAFGSELAISQPKSSTKLLSLNDPQFPSNWLKPFWIRLQELKAPDPEIAKLMEEASSSYLRLDLAQSHAAIMAAANTVLSQAPGVETQKILKDIALYQILLMAEDEKIAGPFEEPQSLLSELELSHLPSSALKDLNLQAFNFKTTENLIAIDGLPLKTGQILKIFPGRHHVHRLISGRVEAAWIRINPDSTFENVQGLWSKGLDDLYSPEFVIQSLRDSAPAEFRNQTLDLQWKSERKRIFSSSAIYQNTQPKFDQNFDTSFGKFDERSETEVLTQDEATNFFQSKWFWIGVGVVVAGSSAYLAYELSQPGKTVVQTP